MSSLGFRPDVEGLRAVAVLLVVAFHAEVGLVSGGFVGVDVFFVISGFLITGLLVEEWSRTGTVSLSHFYARRARRLLPLATVVLFVTALASWMVLPAIDRPDVGTDIRAAALWFANWHFASDATQYMSEAQHSPVLHYWSLSVEEQFYVLWPLLILALARRQRSGRHERQDGDRGRARLFRALLVLGAVSFALSVLTTADQGPWAYFGLHTRAWELAAGGCLALAVPWLPRLTQRGANLLGVAGAAAVGWSVVSLERTTTFPGWIAAVPVLGTVLVLAGGVDPRSVTARVLSLRPFTYIGRLSYGWYLWHWPCLVLAAALWAPATEDTGIPESALSRLGPVPLVGAVVASFLLAAASHALVEQPVRRSVTLARSAGKSLAVGGALVSMALIGPAVAAEVAGEPRGGSSTADARPLDPGTAGPAVTPGSTGTTAAAPVRPYPPLAMSPAAARKQFNEVPGCFVQFTERTAGSSCRFGDEDGTKVVVLVGDSHAAHWFPAMEQLAKANHWQLWFWSKAACAISDVKVFTTAYNREYDECGSWRRDVLAKIEALPRVDAVVIGRSFGYLPILMDGDDRVKDPRLAARMWGDGMRRTLQSLEGDTRQVMLIRETPRPGKDVPACLSENGNRAQRCDYPKDSTTLLKDAPLFEYERVAAPPGLPLRVLDMTSVICADDPCRVVSPKGTVVFRDKHHLTVTYAKEIAPVLGRRIMRYL